MAFLNIEVKDNSTPLTPAEFNYIVDKLNTMRLRDLNDVQSADAQDKNIIQHNGSGWVFYTIEDDFYTKDEINLIFGYDGGGDLPQLTINWGEIQGTIRDQADLVANYGDLKAASNVWDGKHFAENYILNGSTEVEVGVGTMDNWNISDGTNLISITDDDTLIIQGSNVDFDYINNTFNINTSWIDIIGTQADVEVGGFSNSVGYVTIAHNHDDIYFKETEHLLVSSGASASGFPLILDATGKIDISMIPAGGLPTTTIHTPMNIEFSVDKLERTGLNAAHGSFYELAPAGTPISNGTPINVTSGLSKLLFAPLVGTIGGTVTFTGTKVDRDTGAETASYSDVRPLTTLATHTETADSLGNPVHDYTNAVISSVWFKGAVTVTVSTANLTSCTLNQLAFEQWNDESDITINTVDLGFTVNNSSAEASFHLYTVEVGIDGLTEIHDLSGEMVVDNVSTDRYYRLRRGSLAKALDGTTDGVVLDMNFAPANQQYFEQITAKVWATANQDVTVEAGMLSLTGDGVDNTDPRNPIMDLSNYADTTQDVTFAGKVTLNADPVADLEAATKQYVDGTVAKDGAAFLADTQTFLGVNTFSASSTIFGSTGAVNAVQTFKFTGSVGSSTFGIYTDAFKLVYEGSSILEGNSTYLRFPTLTDLQIDNGTDDFAVTKGWIENQGYGIGGGINHAPSDGNEYVSKDGSWQVSSGVGGGGAVDSVNGLVGIVNLTAFLIPNTPSGNLVATTVQGALNELQTEIDGIDGTTAIGRYDEGSGDTFYPVGNNRDYCGVGGIGALDMSFSDITGTYSPNQGGIGSQSLTFGYNNKNEGYAAILMGEESNTLSSGTYTANFGYDNIVGGYSSFCHGVYNEVTPNYSYVVGNSNKLTTGGGNIMLGYALSNSITQFDKTIFIGSANVEPSTYGSGNDMIMVVGNGTVTESLGAFSRDVPSDALRIWKSGLIEATSLTDVLIATSDDSLITKRYFDANQGSGGDAFFDSIALSFTNKTVENGVITKGGFNFIHDYTNSPSYGTLNFARNLFVGINAGNFNLNSADETGIKGIINTGVGNEVLVSLTTGSWNNMFGSEAGYSITTGDANQGIGDGTLYYLTTGNDNLAIGKNALQNIITSDNNVAIGRNAGYFFGAAGGTDLLTDGANHTLIGWRTRPSADGTVNEVAIGYDALGKGSNTAVIGSSSILKISSGADYVAVDDEDLVTKGHLDTSFSNFSVSPNSIVHLAKTDAQNLGGANGNVNVVGWDSELVKETGYTHDNVTDNSRITVANTGRYQVTCTVGITQGGSARTTWIGRLRVNGTTVHTRGSARNYSRGSGYGDGSITVTTEIELTASDYIEMLIVIDDTDQAYTSPAIANECEFIMREI